MQARHKSNHVALCQRQLEMPGRPVSDAFCEICCSLRPSKLEPAQFRAVIESEYIGCPELKSPVLVEFRIENEQLPVRRSSMFFP